MNELAAGVVGVAVPGLAGEMEAEEMVRAHSMRSGHAGSGWGFTLVELLVVIAVILILIAIALPNFLEAVTRANITAAYADMRSLGTALEMYNVDHKEYPQAALIYRELRRLTTPVSYIEALPPDLFESSEGGRRTYRYGAMDLDDATRWILASIGPDRSSSTNSSDLDLYPGYDPFLFIGLYPKPFGGGEPFRYMIYSPTNGTVSVGDLYFASDWHPS